MESSLKGSGFLKNLKFELFSDPQWKIKIRKINKRRIYIYLIKIGRIE